MHKRFTCANGHEWGSPAAGGLVVAAIACPTCGAPANTAACFATGQTPPTVPDERGGRIAPPADPASLPGTFGRYEIQEELGRGGMGRVYKAFDRELCRVIALKVPHFQPHDSEGLRRFRQEAQAAATFNHPNLCPVFDVGEHNGTPYLTMPFLRGQSLAAILDAARQAGKPLPERQVALVVRKLALALEHAHRKGVVHRDLKPGNVIIQRQEGAQEPLIVDFGLARRQTEDPRLTATGVVMGTPGYMAPEQAAGLTRDTGPAGDIYSLGVILYELLTLRLPFEGAAILYKIVHEPPDPPSRYRPNLDAALEGICLKCLQKSPGSRFASMKELAVDLTGWLKAQGKGQETAGESIGPAGGVFAELAEGPTPPRRRRGSRIPLWSILLASAVPLLLLAGAVVYMATDYGTVKVELSDPTAEVEVRVDGNVVTLKSAGDTVTLKAGKHEMEVVGDRYRTFTRSFTLKRGAKELVKVTLEPKDVAPKPAALSPESRTEAAEVPKAATAKPPQWRPLFNGKDLTGWRVFLDRGRWRVENGAIHGSGPLSGLFSERGDYENFHVRCEAKINDGGESSLHLREPFGDPKCYVAPIQLIRPQLRTGSLKFLSDATTAPETHTTIEVAERLHKPNEWFTLEAIAQGNRIVIKVNGKTTVDFLDEKRTYTKGHIGLAQHREGSEVWFRKVEVMELPPPDSQGTLPAARGAETPPFVSLFNGKNLAGWVGKDGGPAAWKVEDGYLEVVPGHGDIWTKETFGDFELRAEFWVPSLPGKTGLLRGNSGIFLQGRYEIQVLDSFDNPTKPEGACGALYGQVGPSRNASKPPGEWQSFDITFRAPRVDSQGTVTEKGRLTVVHNGVKVIDNEAFDRVTQMALPDKRQGTPGPIRLQDHGEPVRFRNLKIRPLSASTPAEETDSRKLDWRLPENLDRLMKEQLREQRIRALRDRFTQESKAAASSGIPADAVSFKGHRYKFFAEKLTWKEAKAKCAALGGHLVVIDSEAENRFVAGLVEKAGWLDTWIGITDEASEGDWRTVEGKALTYTNWFANQPNNKGGVEHYGLLSNRAIRRPLGWTWCDQPNETTDHKPGYVCEWDEGR